VNKKIKKVILYFIGLLVAMTVVFLLISWFSKEYLLTALNCEKEKVNIVLYKDKYYTYDFPFDFIPFCGEVMVKNSKLLYISKYKNGSLNNERKIFYENGQLKILALFKKGMLDGKFIGWYENGQKAIETFYKNDLESGQRVERYENGAPKSISHYKEGKKHGEFITWYDKGSMSKDDWKQNSSPKTISLYKDDIEQGAKIIFNKNGIISTKKEFTRKENGQ